MPSGRVHATVTLVAAATTPFGLLALGAPLPGVGAYALGCLAGIVVTPDLDVDAGNLSMHVIRRLFGRGAGWLWELFWKPYALVMPHRSFLSHGLLISTLIRVAYIAVWIGIGLWLLRLPMPVWSPLWIWAFAGLAISDVLHALMDWLS